MMAHHWLTFKQKKNDCFIINEGLDYVQCPQIWNHEMDKKYVKGATKYSSDSWKL